MSRKLITGCILLFSSTVALAATTVISVGGNPRGVAVTPDGTRALVTNNSNPGTVSVVSLGSGSVTATIPVGKFPTGIAVSPDGTKALVLNGADSNNVSVIDLATNRVTSTISPGCVGTTLYDIAFTPNGSRAVMGDLSAGCTQSGLDVINVAAGTISFINLNPFNGPFGVAVTPDGNSALATNGILGQTIKRINLSTSAVTTISGTSASFGVAVTPDGTSALVTSGESDTVKRINLATNTVTATIPYSSNVDTHNVAITPNGQSAVVVGDFDAALISLATNTVQTTYPVVGASVAITPDGTKALVTNPFARTLSVISLLNDSDRLFNWAEASYSQFFKPGGVAAQTALGYYFRYYSQTNVYLGSKDSRIFVYSPSLIGPDILDLGPLSVWLPQAQAAGY